MIRFMRFGAGAGIAGLACVLLGACSGKSELVCASDLEYMQAQTSDPLRIPDGLSVPDQSNSLQIPDVLPMSAEDRAAIEAGNCLDHSPAFSVRD